MAHQPVLAPAVDEDAGGVDRVQPLARAGPSVRTSLGATEPTPGSASRRRAAATKPGVRKVSGCMNSTASPSVLRSAAFVAAGQECARSRRTTARPAPAATAAVESSEALSRVLGQIAQKSIAQTVDPLEMLEKQDEPLEMARFQLAVDTIKRMRNRMRDLAILQVVLQVKNVTTDLLDIAVLPF